MRSVLCFRDYRNFISDGSVDWIGYILPHDLFVLLVGTHALQVGEMVSVWRALISLQGRSSALCAVGQGRVSVHSGSRSAGQSPSSLPQAMPDPGVGSGCRGQCYKRGVVSVILDHFLLSFFICFRLKWAFKNVPLTLVCFRYLVQ